MLDKDELIYTKILNHNATVKEIIDYIDGLHEYISHLNKERDLFHRVMEDRQEKIRELEIKIKNSSVNNHKLKNKNKNLRNQNEKLKEMLGENT